MAGRQRHQTVNSKQQGKQQQQQREQKQQQQQREQEGQRAAIVLCRVLCFFVAAPSAILKLFAAVIKFALALQLIAPQLLASTATAMATAMTMAMATSTVAAQI